MPTVASKKKKTTKKTTKKSSAKGGSAAQPKAAPKSSDNGATKVEEVRYEKVVFQIFREGEKLERFTREHGRKLLGWGQPPKGVKEGVVKVGTESVFCSNNHKNRMPNWPWVQTIAQDILTRKYRFNCQNIIIGRYGNVITGQHRLYALELACQEWAKNPGKWKDYWQEEPWIETTVCFGCPEDKDTLDTIDFAKPLSIADVIFRRGVFDGLKANDRMKCARMCGDAVKLLWSRTGAAELAHAPKRTYAESMAFIEHHPRILDCVRHIFEENGKDKLSRYLPVGYAAGLMYLFGVSKTERENDGGTGYSQLDVPTEQALDFSRWDAANDFWVTLAFGNQSGGKKLHALVEMLGREFEEGMEPWVLSERIALVIKSWNLYARGKAVTEAAIKLQTVKDSEGYEHLAEDPTCGGIDLGSDFQPYSEDDDAEE